MAELKGKNAAVASDVNGANKIASGEHVGRVRCLYDEITLTAETAANDTVLIGAKLQAGARVLEAVVASPDLGVGTVNLGWNANKEDAQDLDGFIAAGDNSGQAAKLVMAAGAPGLGKKFESETQVVLQFTGITTSGTGKTVKAWLYYVLD